jgi:hypothetical protein
VLQAPPQSPAFASTVWPSEHADTWRSHAVPDGLPAGVSQQSLRTATATLPQSPVWGYTETNGDLYVLGGAPYLLDVFTTLIRGAPKASLPLLIKRSKAYSATVTPYIARIDPRTMAVSLLHLTGGSSINYIGGMLIDSNGFIYADARSVLYKINPTTMSIVASTALPWAPKDSGAPNSNTAYNGIQATQSGDLILKGWASTGGGKNSPAVLLRINPDSLAIEAKLVTSSGSGGARMTIVYTGGQNYLYFPGRTQTLRFLLTPTAFVPDGSFTKTYVVAGSGSTEASSDVFMGGAVDFADNTTPNATAPMDVFAEPSSGASLQSQRALKSTSAGWNFFMAAGDPYRSGILVVQDQLSGHLAGFLACNGGQTLKKIWENDAIQSTAGLAIDYANGQLYADDRHCVLGSCKLYLVVMNLHTGAQIAKVRVAGTKPTIGQIFIGGNNAVYYLSTQAGSANGYITKVTATS